MSIGRPISASKRRLNPLMAELRNNRVEQGFTQVALAKRIGCHRDQLFDWETARKTPRSDNLIAWANALGFEVELKPQTEGRFLAWAREVLR